MPGSPEMLFFPTDRPRCGRVLSRLIRIVRATRAVVDALELICGREDDALPVRASWPPSRRSCIATRTNGKLLSLFPCGPRAARWPTQPRTFRPSSIPSRSTSRAIRDFAISRHKSVGNTAKFHAACRPPGLSPSQVGRADYEEESHPIHRLLFAYSPESKGGVDLGRDRQSPSILPDLARVGNDLALNIARNTRSGLDCTIAFNAELFEPATIRRMLGHLLVLLSSAAANPDGPISSLPIMTDVERRLLIEEWSGPARSAPSPRGKFIHEAFEEQVGRTLPTPSRSSSRRLV